MTTKFAVALAGLAIGCQALLGDADDPIQVDSEFVFQIRESHAMDGSVGAPSPVLDIATAQALECCNYEIITRIETQGEDLLVDLLGVKLPGGGCLTAFGPAQARIPLASLPPYQRIVFGYHGEIEAFTVTRDEHSFHISGENGGLIHTVDTLVWRYPRQSMVYTCGTLREDSCLCDQFRDTLFAHLNLEPIPVPETGDWPYPRQSIGYWHNMTPLVFRYSSEAEFDRAGVLLQEFARSTLVDRRGVGLALHNWRNEHFASWMVRAPQLPGREQ